MIGRDTFVFGDGRRSGENHVMNLKNKFGMNVSAEQVAGQFGRHTVEVMKENYLQKKKNTEAIEAYNLIRETYDVLEFDENEEVDAFAHQKKVLNSFKANKKFLKDKRPSLELLSQVMPVENQITLTSRTPSSSNAKIITEKKKTN